MKTCYLLFMPYYIIYAKSSSEKRVLKELRKIAKDHGHIIDFKLQQKEMINTSRTGKVTKLYNILPGYIFVSSESRLSKADLLDYSQSKGMFFFLHYPDGSVELKGDDEGYAATIFQLPSTITAANVLIKEGQLVLISRGNFKDIKAKVLKIYKKRSRVDVEIFFMNRNTRLSLPYTSVETI